MLVARGSEVGRTARRVRAKKKERERASDRKRERERERERGKSGAKKATEVWRSNGRNPTEGEKGSRRGRGQNAWQAFLRLPGNLDQFRKDVPTPPRKRSHIERNAPKLFYECRRFTTVLTRLVSRSGVLRGRSYSARKEIRMRAHSQTRTIVRRMFLLIPISPALVADDLVWIRVCCITVHSHGRQRTRYFARSRKRYYN